MSGTTVDASGPDRIEADFRQVMAWVTEHACAEGREGEVMEALYDVVVGVGDDEGEDHLS
jgi:hypothetical protein